MANWLVTTRNLAGDQKQVRLTGKPVIGSFRPDGYQVIHVTEDPTDELMASFDEVFAKYKGLFGDGR